MPDIQVQRHPIFYINDGSLHVRVQNYCYKIHRYFLLRESVSFRDLLEYIGHHSDSELGRSDENAITLVDASSAEFSAFLKHYYYGMRLDYDPTVEEWKALLSASQSFDCPRLRSQAIEALEGSRGSDEGLSAMVQVQLALKYDIKAWLRPAYMEIVRRAEMLSMDEIMHLPTVIALLLERSREVYHCHHNWHYQREEDGGLYRPLATVKTAEEVFEEQLAALRIDVMGKNMSGIAA